MALTLSRPPRMRLTAHDTEPVAEPVAEVPPVAPVEPESPSPGDKPKPAPPKPEPKPVVPVEPDVGDAGKRAIEAERATAKAERAKAAKAEAELAAANKRIQDFEDASKSELEKAQAQAARAQEQAAAANRRAVTSDIRSAAISADAVDPSDVVDLLGFRTDDFIKDGVIDTAAIDAAVAEMLERKGHWKKQPAAPAPLVPEKKSAPKPDPSQGPRGPAPEIDYRTASKAEVDAAMAAHGIRRH